MPVKPVRTVGWTKANVAATILLVTQQQREEIASRVRAEMDRQGLTNSRLARTADISEKTVSRLINGRIEPRYDTLERIAKALDVPQRDLRGSPVAPLGLGGQSPVELRLDQLFTLVRGLDEQVRLLRAELANGEAEDLRRSEASATPTRRAQRRRPR